MKIPDEILVAMEEAIRGGLYGVRAKPRRLVKYALTVQDFSDMLDRQEHRCWICRKRFSASVLPVVDHNHVTNKVRGLLCGQCNTGLGSFKDDPMALCAAAEYLVAHV